jgi:hypothetical protein
MFKGLSLGFCLAAIAGPAVAQEAGGVTVAPAAVAGLSGLAQLLPFTFPAPTAADLQGRVSAADRQAAHRNMVARVRGDGGFLDGFAFGQPVAPSRFPVAPQGQGFNLVLPPPVIIDHASGPIAFIDGDGNVIQQQSATGSGPIAQQQVATVGNGGKTPGEGRPTVFQGGRAVNLAIAKGHAPAD